MRRIAVVDAPSNLGLRPPTATSVPGCAKAPGALRDSGLLARLGARDAGCITPPRYDPAGWQPGDGVAQADEIAVFVRRLADRIGAILASGDFPVVLGGDCSILLGAGLAMRRYSADLAGRVGLVYVDGHSDFRHEGNASYVGAAAGEALALATGRGQGNLASIEQRRPYFRDVDVVLLGIRTHDEYRLDLQAAGIVARAVPELRSHGAARSAQWAREQLRDCAGFWVHVDVDVLDPAVMPAVDAPDVGGIAYRELEILLSGLVSDPRCVGVQVTVFDPDYDPDGQYAREVTDVLVAGLEPLVTSAALAATDVAPVVSGPPLQAPPAEPFAPVAEALDPPFAPVAEALDPPFVPAAEALDPPFVPAAEALDPPFVPVAEAVDPPLAPVAEAVDPGEEPFEPVAEALEPPFERAAEAMEPPFAPVAEALDPPFVPAADGLDPDGEPVGADPDDVPVQAVTVGEVAEPLGELSPEPADDPVGDPAAAQAGPELDGSPAPAAEDEPQVEELSASAAQAGPEPDGSPAPAAEDEPQVEELSASAAQAGPEPDGPPAPAADLPEAPTGTEPSGDAGGAPSTADGPGATGLDLPPVAWVDVRTGAVVDLAADRGLGRDVAGRGEAPRLPAYSRGAVIGITTRKPIDVEATAEAGAADGGWVAVGGGLAPVDEPGKQDDLDEAGPADAEEPAGGVAVDDGADQAGGAPLFGRPGRKGRRAPRLALTLAPISAPPATGRLARRAEPPQDEAPVQDREAVVPFVPAQGRPPREVAEPPESPLTDVVPAARTPDEGRTPKQR